ncbi:hypothetical protein FB451DRAFT_139066 [Mycena latifolia]|nr:hypothetical protein FB451DRAFT_139066 [Mycena latifolia]
MNSRATDTTTSRAEARARISELNAQISDLKLSLRALCRKRSTIKKQLDSYIYPVLTLPNEIVSEIFTHFIPVYPACPPLIGPLSPSILGQVCRKWRQIAVSTPSLWRAIRLYLDGNERYHSTQFRLFETWLGRSGISPLSITLHYSELNVDLAPFFDTFARHTFHCEVMDLEVSLPHMRLFSSQNLPRLQTLALDLNEKCPRLLDPVDLFDQAPNLTNVTLHAYFDPFRLSLPWRQITTLRDMCMLVNELFEILLLATNLVHCSVALVENGLEDVVLTSHIHLQDLTLTAISPSNTSSQIEIIDKLTLPALRNLQIPEPWLSPTPCATIAAWISRSGCNLEQLHITHSGLSEVSYREALPPVRKIIVEGWEMNRRERR